MATVCRKILQKEGMFGARLPKAESAHSPDHADDRVSGTATSAVTKRRREGRHEKAPPKRGSSEVTKLAGWRPQCPLMVIRT